MTAEQAEALAAFQGEYGRLCALSARAIHNGHDRERVGRAARGLGQDVSTVYVQIRDQRTRANAAHDLCEYAAVPLVDQVNAGRDAKRAVEGEWMVNLPTFTRKP